MFGNYVAPKSTISARDILKAQLLADNHQDKEPNIFDAIQIADDYKRRFGMYVRPDYLFEVWSECATLSERGG